MNDRDILLALFRSAVSAAMPAGLFQGRLPARPAGRTIVLGAGKAAASMAASFEEEWGQPCEGLVVTRYGHRQSTRFIEVVEASHPVPDAAGADTARRILDQARSAGPQDLVVALMSGGASSLLALPAAGITLEQKQIFTRRLLSAGCPIAELNRFRMGLSAIKGGRLAAAVGDAQLITFVISDVPGDDPALVGSGPTIPQPFSSDELFAIARRYDIEPDRSVRDAILANACESRRARSAVEVIATPMQALHAAALTARNFGITPLILGDRIEGEAREVAKALGGIAISCLNDGYPVRPPVVLLSGGETTVTVRGSGRGGRNAEFLLSLLQVSKGQFSALAADTDGIDGVETNAGAWFDPTIFSDVGSAELRLGDYLQDNDAFSFFERVGTLIETGPTRTNVNDFRAILIRS